MRLLCVFVVFNIFTSETSFSAPKFIPAQIEIVPGVKINDLKWKNEFIRVRDESSKQNQRYIIILAGSFKREGWQLTLNQKPIKRNEVGGFVDEEIITKEKRTFEFVATGPEGKTEKEKIVVQGPMWDPPKKKTEVLQAPKRLFIVPGLGVSSITAKETAIPNYSTIALTAKMSINYLLIPRKVDLRVSFFLTALQLTKNEEITARYLGVNARVGYILPFVELPWAVSLYGGWYYTTTFVQANAFGYKNLSGPQIYPSVVRAFPNGDALAWYFKFSPVAGSLKLLSMSDREIASGLAYIHPLKNGHVLSGSFDYSDIQLIFNGINSQTDSLTLGASYGL